MAMLHCYRSSRDEREKHVQDRFAQGAAHVVWLDETLCDEMLITDQDTVFSFNGREEMFAALKERLCFFESIHYSNPVLYSQDSSQDDLLKKDIDAYLQVRAEDLRIRKELQERSSFTKLSQYFGFAAKPVAPTETVEPVKSGYEVRGTGIVIPVQDPILAVAVARGKISLDI